MKYLTLAVDPFGIPLRLKGDFARSTWPVKLTTELCDTILRWNEEFSRIVSSEDLYDPGELLEIRKGLNEEGFRLATRINQESHGEYAVQFFPEQ
jgi:hypothetical protein